MAQGGKAPCLEWLCTKPFPGPAAKGELTRQARLCKAQLKPQQSWGRSLGDAVCAPGGDWLLVHTHTPSFSFLQRQHIPALCMFLPAGSAGMVGAGWRFKGSHPFWKRGTLLLGKLSSLKINKHRDLEKIPVQSLACPSVGAWKGNSVLLRS